MCTLDNEGRHADPGAIYADACIGLMDSVINRIPAVAPARKALIALIQMRPSERTQGLVPKQFDHAICLLGGPIKTPHIPDARRQTHHGGEHAGNVTPNDAPWGGGLVTQGSCGRARGDSRANRKATRAYHEEGVYGAALLKEKHSAGTVGSHLSHPRGNLHGHIGHEDGTVSQPSPKR